MLGSSLLQIWSAYIKSVGEWYAKESTAPQSPVIDTHVEASVMGKVDIRNAKLDQGFTKPCTGLWSSPGPAGWHAWVITVTDLVRVYKVRVTHGLYIRGPDL
jgi:hypothetical protein